MATAGRSGSDGPPAMSKSTISTFELFQMFPDAFGGDVPDYLKAEFAALETAVIAAEGGAS